MIKLSTAGANALRQWVAVYPLYNNYAALDIESDGLNVDKDHVIHLGWCLTDDGRQTRCNGAVIDWTKVMTVEERRAFEIALERTRLAMAAKGQQYRWTIELVQELGIHPAEAVNKFLADCDGRPFVTHYGWGFDYPMLLRLVRQYSERTIPFGPTTYLMDTCLMARAVLAGAHPRTHEDYSAYARRLQETRCGKHSLRDCITMFDLNAWGADPKHGHNAEYDAWVCSLLLERFRELASPTQSVPAPAAKTNDVLAAGTAVPVRVTKTDPPALAPAPAPAPAMAPDDLFKTGQSMAIYMMSMTAAEKSRQLDLLRAMNTSLHALVVQLMKEVRT